MRFIQTFALLALAVVTAATAAETELYVVNPAFSPFDAVGRVVTIKGVGFTSSTVVSFEGVAASTTFIDSRTLLAVVPTVASARITSVVADDPANGTDEFFPFFYTDPVIYVATTGNDGNTGTDPNAPKLTIAGGLSEASTTVPTEVRVAAGLYVESDVSVPTQTVLSCGWAPGFGLRDPDIHVTDIDGNRRGSVARSTSLQNISAIDGCTLRNGLTDGDGGGGVRISADSSVVNNNVIAGNVATRTGGGAYFRATTAFGGTPTFSNNVIVGNRAYNKNGAGLGVYASYNTQTPIRVNVTGNLIVGNRALAGRGGGISLATGSYASYNTGTLKISDNVVAHNNAKTGAGIDATTLGFGDFFDLTLNNNLVIANAATGAGGGISFQGIGSLAGSVTFGTVAENSAAPWTGGGFLIGGAVSLAPGFEARDLILWGNVGEDVAGLALTTVTYSDSGTALGGVGNISADPAFASGTLSDFYLTQADPNLPDSPAVDAGSGPAADLSVESLTTRVDGIDDSGTADMGYHHGAATGASSQPIAVNRVDPFKGDFGGDTWVLVRGDGFDPGAQAEFHGVPATSTIFVSNRRLLAKPPAHAIGLVDVGVTNPDLTSAALPAGYLYMDIDPPGWPTTVGLVSGRGGVDACQRTAILNWNPAVDEASEPVVYDVHRVECDPSLGDPAKPCNNWGFYPNAANYLGSTPHLTYVDPIMGSSDFRWIYAVRARDTAPYSVNREYNHVKRMVDGVVAGVEEPPSEVGETLGWVAGTDDTLEWAVAEGAFAYGVYRETDRFAYASPGTLTKYATLNPSSNDANGDGVTDTEFLDAASPAVGQIFYYKLTAIDHCSTETTSEL
jgi:hypothetical protein